MLNKETLLLVNAFIGGGLIKLYDDIKDNNLVSDEDEASNPKMTILKIMIVVLFFITLMTDPTTLFIVCILIPLCIYVDEVDIELWRLLIYVSGIALVLNIDSIFENIPEKMMLSIAIGALIYFEAKLIPEEKSKRKTIFRLSFLILGGFAIYYSRFTSYKFMNVLLMSFMGYGVSNLLFQYFCLNDASEDSASNNVNVESSNNV